jgi:hypothetical protein
MFMTKATSRWIVIAGAVDTNMFMPKSNVRPTTIAREDCLSLRKETLLIPLTL